MSALNEKSISLLKYLSDVSSLMNQTKMMLIGNSPDQIIESLPELETAGRDIGSKLMLISVTLKEVLQVYNYTLHDVNTLRDDLLSQIAERNENSTPLNITGSVYSENEVLYDINNSFDNDMEQSVSGIYLDPLYDMKDYSVLSVIKMLESKSSLLKEISYISQKEISAFYTIVESKKKDILEFQSFLNSADISNAFYSGDSVRIKAAIQQLIKDVTSYEIAFNTFRENFKKLFNIFNAIIANYMIYQKAVKSYTSLAMESTIISANVYYEFC